MANGDFFRVRKLLDTQLPDARLTTLSACETGRVGVDLRQEAIMLPSAMVQAGFSGVAASLWSVVDIGAAIPMVRFYRTWRVEGLEPVHALRPAQHWVRGSANRE